MRDEVVTLNMMPSSKDNVPLEFRKLIWNKGERHDLRKLYFIPALTVFCPHNQEFLLKKVNSTNVNKYHIRSM